MLSHRIFFQIINKTVLYATSLFTIDDRVTTAAYYDKKRASSYCLVLCRIRSTALQLCSDRKRIFPNVYNAVIIFI